MSKQVTNRTASERSTSAQDTKIPASLASRPGAGLFTAAASREMQDIRESCRLEVLQTILGTSDMELRPGTFSLLRLLQGVVARIRNEAGGDEVDLVVRIDETVEDRMRGNSKPLHRLLFELVRVALSCAGRNTVRIDVQPVLQCDVEPVRRSKRQELIFIVRHDGVAHTSLPRSLRRRLEGLNGTFYQHRSTVGFTTSFLKVVERFVPKNPGVAAPVPVVDFRGRCILLAEDNEAYRIILGAYLKKAGLIPTVVENGRDAVRAVRGRRDAGSRAYAFVLMDLRMPQLDGAAATRQIRRFLPAETTLPIVGMVNPAHPEDVATAYEAGMDDHLFKPIDPVSLRKTLLRQVMR